MRNESELRGQGAELLGNSAKLAPETYNPLRTIQRWIAWQVILLPISLAASSTTLYLALTQPESPPGNIALVSIGIANALAGTLTAISMRLNVVERREMIRTAVERGLNVTGRVFKQIRPASAV